MISVQEYNLGKSTKNGNGNNNYNNNNFCSTSDLFTIIHLISLCCVFYADIYIVLQNQY